MLPNRLLSCSGARWSSKKALSLLVLLTGGLGTLSVIKAQSAIFTVNSTSDAVDTNVGDGMCATSASECTLRAAIQESNATADRDTIRFAIPGTGVKTISLGSPLLITAPVTIDGYSQPGASVNTATVGTNARISVVVKSGDYSVFEVRGGGGVADLGSMIRGLVIQNQSTSYAAIAFLRDINGIADAGGNVVAGCFVGTTQTGASDGLRGGNISVFGTQNDRIGGPSLADRNLLSDCTSGVYLGDGNGAGANNTIIQNNLIGTAATGLTDVGNSNGIMVVKSSGVQILNNVISGSSSDGIFIFADSYEGYSQAIYNTTIQGNLIGLNAAGTAALGNTTGIRLSVGGSGYHGFGLISGVQIGGMNTGQGNIISGNTGSGISTNGGVFNGSIRLAGLVIAGNTIGLNQAGDAKIGNGQYGIECNTGDTIIGGATAASRNIVSGNGKTGIFFGGIGGATIQNNYIGTNKAGTAALGNGESGIQIGSGYAQTYGVTVSDNLLSGNTQHGLYLYGFTGAPDGTPTPYIMVRGNFIGTNATGTAAIPNASQGIHLFNSQYVLIGGTTATDRNVIAGNGGHGIGIDRAINNNIQGNFIGVNNDGSTLLGNSGSGIAVYDYTGPNTVGIAPGGTEGGNIIAGNAGGVYLYGGSSSGIRMSGNSIYSNTNLGTDLNGDGVTQNDSGDTDGGANGLQNFPVITTIKGNVVNYTLNSTPNTTFRIEVFANNTADASGNGEGQRYLGTQNVTTDAAGNKTFSYTAPSSISGKFISLTATDPNGNTSEFSKTVQAPVNTLTASISDVTVSEGPDLNTTTAEFTVTLSKAPTNTFTVRYTTANNTAKAPQDYATANTVLSIPTNATSGKFSVTVKGDLLDEDDETFFVNLSLASEGSLVDNQGIGTIIDNDPLPSLSISNATVAEVDSGITNATFTVTLSPASGRAVTVNYATADSTAKQPDDYTSKSGTLTFNPSQTTQTFTVAVAGDTLDESNETFLVNLAGAVNATMSDPRGVGTITDNDPSPALGISDVTIAEGDSGTTNAIFTVTLTSESGLPITVNYATANGTTDPATVGSDYENSNGSVPFAPGETEKTITVTIIGDTTDEAHETFFINLSGATNATIADNQGLGTITDDEFSALTISDAAVTEGDSGTLNMSFIVTIAPVTNKTVTVDYTTADGTAKQPDDYTTQSGTLTFMPRQTTQTIEVPIKGDLINEDPETLEVKLSNATNATIADSEASGIITDNDPLPSLSINDVTVVEGVGGITTSLVFTVRLSSESGRTVTVNYATADGTAKQPGDYTAQSGTLTFTPRQTTKPIIIDLRNDGLDEDDEQLTVNLSAASNAVISKTQGTGTITDDDATPSLSINDPFKTEGNYVTTDAVFTVTLSSISGRTITVNYATGDFTATQPDDYTTTTGTLIFEPGQDTKTVKVPVVGDLDDENSETFKVTLSGAVNANISKAQGTCEIRDDDVLTLSISDCYPLETNFINNAVFTVNLLAKSNQTVTVNYATSDGSAVSTSDYVAKTGTLTFNPGETQKTITARVMGDTLPENDETFFMNLSNPVNAPIQRGRAVGIIRDDDGTPSLKVNSPAAIKEGISTSAGKVTFNITLSAASGREVKVDYQTSDGVSNPAIANEDYQPVSSTLTFAPGETTKSVTVPFIGDSKDELDESFMLTLTTPVNATIETDTGTAVIIDDDDPPTFSIGDISITESTGKGIIAAFPIKLSAPSGLTTGITCATTDGTAKAPYDYTANRVNFSFAPGETAKTFFVDITGDSLDEDGEALYALLTSPINAGVLKGRGTCKISDDDASPTISIEDLSIGEGNSGQRTATFKLHLSAPSGKLVKVNYATANGTAVAGIDYEVASATQIAFTTGQTVTLARVLLNGDLLNEPDETFKVNLSSAINATIADSQATCVILNDDSAPSLSINDVSVSEGNSGTKNLTFTVSLSAPSGQAITVNYATADGTARSTSDYIGQSGPLSFTAGQTSKTITVTIDGDTTVEADETLFVLLSGAINASIGRARGTGTIANDDSSG